MVKDSGYSKATLERMFKYYLNAGPKFAIRARKKVHLLIDGNYFSNNLCLVVYRDNDMKFTQLYRFSHGEIYTEIVEDLKHLKSFGVKLESVTCDGNKATIKAIVEVYPDIIIQRCLVHVHRMSNVWLRQNPKLQLSKDLKLIVNLLPRVKSENDKLFFIKSFNDWYNSNKLYINEKSFTSDTERWWYKHRELRRAAISVRNAIPNLFHFINNENIPKSTNGLESFFGHLKDTLSIHRGLSYKNRKKFIVWYLHFKNKSTNKVL